MIPDKAALVAKHLFFVLAGAVLYLVLYGCLLGMLQGMVDQSPPQTPPWYIGAIYVIFAFPAAYLFQIFEGSLNPLIGSGSGAIFLMLGLNGIFWGEFAVLLAQLISRWRKRRASRQAV